jgi:hypothetical protein
MTEFEFAAIIIAAVSWLFLTVSNVQSFSIAF